MFFESISQDTAKLLGNKELWSCSGRVVNGIKLQGKKKKKPCTTLNVSMFRWLHNVFDGIDLWKWISVISQWILTEGWFGISSMILSCPFCKHAQEEMTATQ